MYWLPILEKNSQSLVYFEQTVERDEDGNETVTSKKETPIKLKGKKRRSKKPEEVEEIIKERKGKTKWTG